MQCWVVGCCCCDAQGRRCAPQRGAKGKQMLTIRSFLLSLVCERKEAKCTYLGNLLDFGDKLEKRVEARSAGL